MPHIYKTEAAHVAHNDRNRAYWERLKAQREPRVFKAHDYPVRLRLQRLLAHIKFRCAHFPRYAGRGIQCRVTFDDLLFAWNRDGADKMTRPSIDRKENDGHYEPSNIRFIELVDNIRLGVQVRDKESPHV